MKKDKSHFFYEKITSISDDGFIIVNHQGFIIDINDKYCNFLGKKDKNNVIGKHIKEIISNSKMLEVMDKKYTEEIGVHHYLEKGVKEKTVLVTRSYVENDKGEVIGGIAQVKFRLQSLDIAKKLTKEYETYEFYKLEYENSIKNNFSFKTLIGSSEIFLEKIKQAKKAAETNFSILLTGETGTGKEIFAKAIHKASLRSQNPMISINCAAIPKDLLESELFGYVEGAFTGAKKGGKKGKFLIANEGTIFLDEIGDMPISMQAKLLRVLQEKEIEPIGSTQTIPINVRIIAATRKDLHKMVLEGTFREDLFYRLNVININLPPLKERKQDILELAEFFLKKLNIEYSNNKKFSKDVKEVFSTYSWPGNIRELDNIIKSAFVSSKLKYITLEDLPSKLLNNYENFSYDSYEFLGLHNAVENFEKSLIIKILKKNNWCCSKAAKEMNIHRSLLYKKIEKHKIYKTQK